MEKHSFSDENRAHKSNKFACAAVTHTHTRALKPNCKCQKYLCHTMTFRRIDSLLHLLQKSTNERVRAREWFTWKIVFESKYSNVDTYNVRAIWILNYIAIFVRFCVICPVRWFYRPTQLQKKFFFHKSLAPVLCIQISIIYLMNYL